jgi:hypothetical protein
MSRVLAWQLKALAGRRWLPLPVQVLYGALVAGPKGPGDDTYEDRRDDYVSNEVGGALCVAPGAQQAANHGMPQRGGGVHAALHLVASVLGHLLPLQSLGLASQVAIDYNAGFTGALAGLLQVTP